LFVPAAIGLQLANPQLRPLVLVGDGAFQMTGLELSTVARFGLNPIVIVLNNGGYVTERFILDGPFNDITPWNDYRLPEVLGSDGRVGRCPAGHEDGHAGRDDRRADPSCSAQAVSRPVECGADT
jgi:TPP-dependent 2-oxoacid decarboxylase